jgi:FKBP-type peptidyl-prolyl cis-trans isomerase
MNKSKFVKFATTLVVMTIMVPMLFAAGMKETAQGAVVGRIVSVERIGASDEITVRTENGEMAAYLAGAQTESSFPVASLAVGDYIEIVASDRMATSIRFINPLVALKIKDISISSSMAEIPETLVERFSYTYGYMLLETFAGQNLYFDGGYYIKGALDAVSTVRDNVPGFYTTDTMYDLIDQYQQEIWEQGLAATDYGQPYESVEEIMALPVTEDLAYSFSYTYGYLLTYNMLAQGIELDDDYYVAGLMDCAFDNETLLTETQRQDAFTEYQQKVEEDYAEWVEQAKVVNLEAAETYLEENATNEGVITTDSGLQYQVQTEGTGPKPVATDTVEVNYQLQLADGTIVDSSYDSGSPAKFRVDQVIPGFQEALLNMNTGSVIRCWIHPSLGYGEEGNQNIEPNTLLIFDIELVSIDPVAESGN